MPIFQIKRKIIFDLHNFNYSFAHVLLSFIKNIIEAANITKADSIHPGFGFLSENSQFSKICEESNINFIGPSSNVIELLGNKSNSKELMKNEGIPVIPGSDGSIKNLKQAVLVCEKIGYPILLKAAAGGGGKGIRIVNSFEELESNYNIVKQEAKISFNDDEIYIEKYIKNPRHVEIQILADEHGNVIHLGERDCTIQRKHQKVIEETPSTIIDEKLRNKMGNMAVKAISCRDYPLVQGYVLWIAILYMCINLLVDLSYTYLDPRIKEVK